MATLDATRALEATRKASDRLGVRLGLEHARAERWKARALLAERDLRNEARAHERETRRLASRLEAALRRLP